MTTELHIRTEVLLHYWKITFPIWLRSLEKMFYYFDARISMQKNHAQKVRQKHDWLQNWVFWHQPLMFHSSPSFMFTHIWNIRWNIRARSSQIPTPGRMMLPVKSEMPMPSDYRTHCSWRDRSQINGTSQTQFNF